MEWFRIIVFILITVALSAADKNEENELWHSSLFMGVQVLPQYDENNSNRGFEQIQFYANLNLDARWVDLTDNLADGIINMGLDVKLLGTPVSRKENNQTIANADFNDVAHTLDTSIYYGYVPQKWRFGLARGLFSELAFETRAGVKVREKKEKNENISTGFAGIGLKYAFFRSNPYSQSGISKRLPDGYLSLQPQWHSQYNNKDNAIRFIAEFQYKIVNEHAWYVGLHSNLGKGADEIYLTLSIKNGMNYFLNLFGINSKE